MRNRNKNKSLSLGFICTCEYSTPLTHMHAHTHTLPTVIKQSRFKVRGGLENLVKAEKKDPCLKASALANVTLVSVLLPPLAFIQHEAQTHTRHKQHCLETSPFQLRRKQYRDLIKKKKIRRSQLLITSYSNCSVFRVFPVLINKNIIAQ